MPKFNRIAEVEFAVPMSSARITVSGLPYVWDSAKCSDMDFPAIMEAVSYLRGKGVKGGLDLVMVSSSPERPQI